MKKLDITVPDMNDSFSRVVLDGKPYLLRFTWNETANRWSFGLYTVHKEPIAVGLRIVPRFPLNIQIAGDAFPRGMFGVYGDIASVGRDDFKTGMAVFSYVPFLTGGV